MGNAASGLPVTLGDEIASCRGASCWAVHEGTEKKTGSRRTVFKASKGELQREELEAAQNAFTRCRTLRHPGVLTAVESAELDTELLVVTDEVVPLTDWVQTLRDQPAQQAAEQLLWGLECMLRALEFLNEQNGLVHGCVSPKAIFVTPGCDWKLGMLDLVSPAAGAGSPLYLRLGPRAAPEETRAPELVPGAQLRSLASAPCILDVYGLGRTFQIAVQAAGEATERVLRPLCMDVVRALCHRNAAERPSASGALSQLVQSRALKRPLVAVLRNLQALPTKEYSAKLSFLEALAKHLDRLPPSVAKHKVLPSLVSVLSTALGEGASKSMGGPDQVRRGIFCCLPMAIKLAGSAYSAGGEDEDYRRVVLPLLQSLVAMQDRGVRLCLLAQVESFAGRVGKDAVNKSFFEPLLQGFADSGSAAVREATLKSLVHLLDHLSERNLNDRLPGQLLRLQRDPEPGIRTNVCIFVGRMAPRLRANVRSQLLMQALPRALKDNFHHARIAAMRALLACEASMDPMGLATKVMPLLAPMLVDPVREVRQVALRGVDKLRDRLVAHGETLEREEQEKSKLAEQAAQAEGSGSVSAVATAAMRSITGAEQQGRDAAAQHQRGQAPQHQGNGARGASLSGGWDDLATALDAEIDLPSAAAKQSGGGSNGTGAAPAAAAGSGWDDDDDWGVLDDDDAGPAKAVRVNASGARHNDAASAAALERKAAAQRKREELRRKREARRSKAAPLAVKTAAAPSIPPSAPASSGWGDLDVGDVDVDGSAASTASLSNLPGKRGESSGSLSGLSVASMPKAKAPALRPTKAAAPSLAGKAGKVGGAKKLAPSAADDDDDWDW